MFNNDGRTKLLSANSDNEMNFGGGTSNWGKELCTWKLLQQRSRAQVGPSTGFVLPKPPAFQDSGRCPLQAFFGVNDFSFGRRLHEPVRKEQAEMCTMRAWCISQFKPGPEIYEHNLLKLRGNSSTAWTRLDKLNSRKKLPRKQPLKYQFFKIFFELIEIWFKM